ncbi:DHA14-like major facilitator [Coniochaeta hoffmannii]|uniref:DHA14-like major facilitator n=1 Tax=Coniochaeta hoffmannii TaxID=91930 RepID=A0AA38RIB7_9PEZI|nr:DHA14-like major facilitator [Coniochaeta hoffmannii]
MADLKAGPAITTADSEAPTIAGSTTSLSEKARSLRDDGASERIERTDGTQQYNTDSDEKHHDLTHQQTATSHGGKEHSLRPTSTREDGTEYPKGMQLVLINVALCMAVFLMSLDNAIIATAIPKITDQFNSLADVGWYGSAYMLTTAALQLLFGRLYTFFNIKWMYLTAIGFFELGSLICGVAPTSTALIVGRAIAGIGAAGLFSGSLIILAHSVPLDKRPIYTGLIGSMYGIASVSGPLLGGAFTDKVTWRWCFFINLPIGAVTVGVITIFFKAPHSKKNTETWKERFWQLDPFGTAVFMPAIICLLLALQWGGTEYAWDNWRIIFLFVMFGVLISIFLFDQHKQGPRATVPPPIFFKRSVWSASFYSFSMGSAFMGAVFYLPIWFQAVKGASAVHSGIMNLPMLISVVIMSVIAGGVVTVIGYYSPFMIIGTVLASIGFGLITTFEPDTRAPIWIGYQIIIGAGLGLGFQQPFIAVQTVLEMKDVPTGTSIITFMQTLGGALFVSVSQNVFTNKLVQYVREYVPGLDPAVVLGTGATAIQHTIRPDQLAGVTQAYSDALTQTFIVFVAMGTLSIVGALVIEWKSVKGKKIEMAAA